MKIALLLLIAVAASSVLYPPRRLFADIVDPHFRTDRSIDTRSARTIVADLIEPSWTNEKKALALFHWLRRVIYHSGPEEPLRHDFNKMIHVFGYGSCYMQTHPLSHLFQQIGFPCRNWVHNGHHMMEAFYDGGWHCFDPHMTFYVYNRTQPPAIASVAELQADPTLAENAVREKRAGPAFLICGDAPTWFSGKTGWTLDSPFLPHQGADSEFGAIRLRRGEKYVRTWKVGKFYRPHAFFEKYSPYHTCGFDSDRRDPVNFPYWEPYAWQEGMAASHRHTGSGYLEYAPDLRGDGWREGAFRAVNLIGDVDSDRPALRPETGGIEAEAIFSVTCPYPVTGATLEWGGRLGEIGDRMTVSVSRKWLGEYGDRAWKEIGEVTKPGAFLQTIDFSDFAEGSWEGYWVRVTVQARDPKTTGLDFWKLHTDFPLNPYVLPQLLPGKNTLFLTASRAEKPWKFRLIWAEGADWKTPREYEATVRGSAHEAVIDVAGPKFPRMESLEFSVDP